MIATEHDHRYFAVGTTLVCVQFTYVAQRYSTLSTGAHTFDWTVCIEPGTVATIIKISSMMTTHAPRDLEIVTLLLSDDRIVYELLECMDGSALYSPPTWRPT